MSQRPLVLTLTASAIMLSVVGCGGSDEMTNSVWERAEPMDVARSEHPATVVDSEIVVAGGLVEAGPGRFTVTDAVEAYDIAEGAWRSLPPLPEPRHHSMAIAWDDGVSELVFVIGGFDESGFAPVATMWMLLDGIWVERAPLPEPVGAGGAVVLDGAVYVVGGTPASRLHRWRPEDDSWTTLASPDAQTEHVAAVVLDGEIWLIGGRWQGEALSSTEIYDPDTDAWREGPPLNEARSGFGATVLDGAIYIAGGEVFDPDRALASVEVYDPEVGAWEAGEPLPLGLHGMPLVAFEGTLYVPGGSSRPNGVDNAGELFTLDPG